MNPCQAASRHMKTAKQYDTRLKLRDFSIDGMLEHHTSFAGDGVVMFRSY